GKVFYGNGQDELPTEVEFLSGILTGQYSGNRWQQKDEPVDFYLVKGIVERIAEQLNVRFTFETTKVDLLHPGRTAYVKLDHPVSKIEYAPIPRFPGVSRDVALVVGTEVSASSLINTINENGEEILNHTEVFDVYEGEHMEEGKKSVAIRIDYLDVNDTLT